MTTLGRPYLLLFVSVYANTILMQLNLMTGYKAGRLADKIQVKFEILKFCID